MIDLGTVRPGSTIRIPFSSFDKDDGSSITMTNFAAADILVYKDGNTTERASTSGFTATTDFDGKTGKHLAIIDLADNTTADFWNAGSEYLVAIDAVTVDGVTTGGWIARFKIGYHSALYNTTIATLASQTSFTLTSGPAEDDALNGFYAIIHDIASAVQIARVLILDYTGSTKTVTLVAGGTFTAAAGDNISIMDMAPMQPATLGRNPVVDSAGLIDSNAVKVGPTGAGTAQTAGDVIGDTNDIQARLPAALTAGGKIKASMDEILAVGQSATDLKDFADDGYDPSTNKVQGVVLTDTVTTYTGNTPQTGDVYPLASTEIADIKAKTDNLPSDPADESLIIAATDAIMTRLGAPAGASVSADVAGVKAETASIQTDTNDIQSRLPAALTGDGNIKADALKFEGADPSDTVKNVILGGLVRTTGAVVDDAGNSASTFLTDFTDTDDDFWKDAFLTFIDGDLAGQTKKITGYDGTTKFVTTDAFTAEPADGDTFLIVNV